MSTPAHDTQPRADQSAGPTLDQVALWVGVAVAVLIVAASYAVSATSVYALLHDYGYARWQSLAGPLIADGPALYGMFRVVARSRRSVPGVRYGWALVITGTAISIGGNVGHALTVRPGSWMAGSIAAVIPLAVLAMLEAIRTDAREVYRQQAVLAQAPPLPTLAQAQPPERPPPERPQPRREITRARQTDAERTRLLDLASQIVAREGRVPPRAQFSRALSQAAGREVSAHHARVVWETVRELPSPTRQTAQTNGGHG